MSEHTSTTVTEGRVRRVPRYGVFLVMGGALGILTAMILTFAFDGVAEPSEIGVTYTASQVFGFLMLYCAAGGVMVGAIVALILDKTVGRRSHTVTLASEKISADEYPRHEPQLSVPSRSNASCTVGPAAPTSASDHPSG